MKKETILFTGYNELGQVLLLDCEYFYQRITPFLKAQDFGQLDFLGFVFNAKEDQPSILTKYRKESRSLIVHVPLASKGLLYLTDQAKQIQIMSSQLLLTIEELSKMPSLKFYDWKALHQAIKSRLEKARVPLAAPAEQALATAA